MTNQSDELLRALETERYYVAKELHDGVAQTTLQLGLQAGICRKLLETGKLEMLENELAQMEDRSQLASAQIRQMIADMRPPMVEPDAGPVDYIQHILDTHIERGGPPVDYQLNESAGLSHFTSVQILTLVRIIQEALLNIRKHTKAENVRLSISAEEDHLYITIADDGPGFDPVEVEARSADKGGAGLTNLRRRAEAIGGELSISRDLIGHGTKVTIILPK